MEMIMFTFSEKSQIILRDLGWFPERKVDPTPWINNLQQAGYTPFDAARKILEHLGGLPLKKPSAYKGVISLSDNTEILFATHPAFEFSADDPPESNSDSAIYWKGHSFVRENSLEICPIGSIRAIITLFVVSDGRIFIGQIYAPKNHPGGQRVSLTFVGNSIGEAVDTLTERCVGYL
jgi:hypothetical protein